MRILGIDPGLETGWALLVNGHLERAFLGDPRHSYLFPDRVVIEYPVVYPHSKTNPNDLITLAIMVGEYRQFFGTERVALVKPQVWKGQLPKSVTEKRVRAKFPNAGDFLDKYPVSTRHNVSDSIGLADWLAARLSHV